MYQLGGTICQKVIRLAKRDERKGREDLLEYIAKFSCWAVLHNKYIKLRKAKKKPETVVKKRFPLLRKSKHGSLF